jgi:hypothetical protein
MIKLPREVARELGFYVYLYADPRTGKPFYVGKGKGARVLSHLLSSHNSRKHKMVAELRACGLQPRIDILAHKLPDEESALRIEAAVIDLFGLDDLTNEVRGWKSRALGRQPMTELVAHYSARPVTITDPVLLIRINQLYRPEMSVQALYEATRGVWKLGDRRESVRYALAVFEGVVREVYEIEHWHRAGTTPYETRDHADVDIPGRWEFTGRAAKKLIRERYRFRRVEHYLRRGLRSPIVYANA